MKILFTGLLLIFSIKSISQPKLTGSEVDNWNLEKGILPISFDRASIYIYLINPNSFSNILQGIEYSPEERRLLGIRRNDKPDFLNISISINHPEINSGDKLQIPLLLYDFRDQKHSQTFQNYGGKYLNNINDENLKNSIMGQVDVQAFISNSNVQFWKEVAGITAKLGKSATALLTNKSFELSQQASNLIKTGMDKLGNLDNGDTNAEWSFFVKLIDYSKSQFYNEKVTAARLYQIHWNNQNATNQNFFDFDENVITEITPNQFSEKIINQNVPYILFVETRLEYQINLGIPSFTTEYKSNIAGKWNDIRDGTRREMAIKYYTLFNTAFEVYQKLNEFNESALSGKIDYSLLARIIDGYYTFSNDLKAEKQLRSSNDIFKKKYSHRYKSISIQIDNKFASGRNCPKGASKYRLK